MPVHVIYIETQSILRISVDLLTGLAAEARTTVGQ
jgi:hypothetical protein